MIRLVWVKRRFRGCYETTLAATRLGTISHLTKGLRPWLTAKPPVPPLRGSIIFPLDRGLTPAANTNVAASRLGRVLFARFIPPQNCICGRDTVSEGPLYPNLPLLGLRLEMREYFRKAGALTRRRQSLADFLRAPSEIGTAPREETPQNRSAAFSYAYLVYFANSIVRLKSAESLQEKKVCGRFPNRDKGNGLPDRIHNVIFDRCRIGQKVGNGASGI